MALCPGLPRMSQYQKKHSPTHTHPDYQTSFINFLHLLLFIASFSFNLRAWQFSSTTSPQVLFGLSLIRELIPLLTVRDNYSCCHLRLLLRLWQEYSKNPSQNWKNKDAAIYLVTSLAAKAQTQKVVDLNVFKCYPDHCDGLFWC